MAKSGKPKAQVKGPRKVKRVTSSPRASAAAGALHAQDEDHIDGCDAEFHDSEATPDAALPRAKGGVEIMRGKRQKKPVRHEEDHIDGCDAEFHESEATPDAALPAAKGGVELARGRRQ
jgi:hypothetical protein